jgi:hypothetical protein
MMRRFMLVCCAIGLAACAKKEKAPAADSSAMATPPAPAPAPAMTLADLAGKWTVKVMPETGDSTLLTYVLNATADTTGWTMTFPGRAAIPIRVGPVSGDSVVTEAGPYPSALRKGVQVWTHNVTRLKDGKLMGTTVAHYATSKPDSVVNLRSEGTKAP